MVRSSGKGALLKHRGLPRHSDPGHRARPAGLGDNDNAYRTQGRGETSTSENKSPGQKASGERDSGTTAHDASSARVADEAISGTEIPRGASTSQYAGTPDKRPRGRPPNSARASSATTSQPPKPGSSKDGTDEDKPKRRRGRPPGSKNNTSRASIGPAAGQFAVPTRLKSNENTTRSRSGLRIASTLSDDQPFAVMVEGGSSGMNFTSALRRGADIDRKRKSKSQDAVRRLRGRPSTASKAEPTYRVYDCRWQTCKAELHNLETLRKHVAKVHRAKAAFGGIPCLWAGCGKVTFVQDRKTGNHTRVHHHLDFGSEALWDVHMNKTHLEAFAWDYGDGPSAGPSG